MKSEHRHELQQNELDKMVRRLKPWLERYAKHVVGSILVLLVLAAAILIGLSWSQQTSAAGWVKLSRLGASETQDQLAPVVERFPHQLPGWWARLRMAELNLENGIIEMFRDRELALKDLERARRDFEDLLKLGGQLPPSLRERAQFGLARCLETLSEGDVTAAREAYRQLLERHPETIYRPLVEQRLKELESPQAAEFYRWFHTVKPRLPEPSKPKDQTGGASSGDATPAEGASSSQTGTVPSTAPTASQTAGQE
ncbi:MAG: hypothetical protein KatS3mg114_0681 [Planctomycetaceae bacterium]|nr:MAG: hypothetical protein KatS3mg114_0681 [Planctomycetaceae bacterium]